MSIRRAFVRLGVTGQPRRKDTTMHYLLETVIALTGAVLANVYAWRATRRADDGS